MKKCISLISILVLMGRLTGLAAPFNSGSDGSYGPLDITASTVLDLPTNGVFHCTTVKITGSTVLTFRPNELNTPVIILATGDVDIDGGAVISVNGESGGLGFSGRGGPGGFDGGMPGVVGAAPGDGFGPGRGRAGTYANAAGGEDVAGSGAYGAPSAYNARNGRPYGNLLLMPLVGGSGGGGTEGTPGYGGAGGGGAILIASNTRIRISGGSAMKAEGGDTLYGGCGSGGAIRLVAPAVTCSSDSALVTYGGSTGVGLGESGGRGRIRIDSLNRGAGFQPGGIIGVFSIGSALLLAPPIVPGLDLLSVAGRPIAEGEPNEVQITLPIGAPVEQVVTIQARDFKGVVPIELVLTPDNGPSQSYVFNLDMGRGRVAQTNVNVTFPPNVLTHVNAWTR